MAANDFDSIKPLLYFCLTVAIVLVIFWFCLPEEDESSDEALRAPVVLPHFPYAARARAAASAPVCAICLDELRRGQLCSEVPACRHIFHEGCIRAWAKEKNSCPMCRAMIVPGGAADNMV